MHLSNAILSKNKHPKSVGSSLSGELPIGIYNSKGKAMNTIITFSEWAEQIHQDISSFSNYKKRFGKDSIFPFPQVVGKDGLEKFYVKEELDNWLAVYKANYPLQNHLFVHSADREVVGATRRLVKLKEVFERTSREIKAIEELLENKKNNQQGE